LSDYHENKATAYLNINQSKGIRLNGMELTQMELNRTEYFQSEGT